MSIWQTSSWQDMLIASRQSEEYFIIERDVAVASSPLAGENGERCFEGMTVFVEKRRVSLGEYGLFVIGLEGEYDEDLQESLQALCKEENYLFAQVETIDYSAILSLAQTPHHNSSPLEEKMKSQNAAPFSPKGQVKEGTQGLSGSGSEAERIQDGGIGEGFDQKYYKKFIPPYTALIDLTQSEDEILSAMKPKGRYNIRLAGKKGVIVEQVEKSEENTRKFHELMSQTTARDSFAGNSLEYYKIFLESLDNAQMFFAYHEGDLIAAGIFVIEGDVMTYYYGASSSQKRNLMAPYLLQWTAVQHAQQRGCKIYDFLGVAGDDEKNSSLSGVTDFKMKLSPKKTLVSHSHLYIHKTWKYKLIMLLRKLKK